MAPVTQEDLPDNALRIGPDNPAAPALYPLVVT